MVRIVLAAASVLALLLANGCIGPTSSPPTTDPAPGTNANGVPSADCAPPVIANAPSAGGGQASVSNNPGSFSYGGQAAAKTGKEDYLWSNPSPTARASFGGQVATGTLHLVIKDACGKKELDKTVASGQGGDYGALPNGRPGKWLISLEFTAFTGQMGLTVTS